VPPETTRPSTFSNVIHRPDEPRPPAPAGATTVPATANVTAARLRHGPANVALDTRYRPGGTSTVAGRVERHASAHARRNGPAASAAPSGRAP